MGLYVILLGAVATLVVFVVATEPSDPKPSDSRFRRRFKQALRRL